MLYELNRSLGQRTRKGDVAIQNDMQCAVAAKRLKMLKPVRELATRNTKWIWPAGLV